MGKRGEMISSKTFEVVRVDVDTTAYVVLIDGGHRLSMDLALASVVRVSKGDIQSLAYIGRQIKEYVGKPVICISSTLAEKLQVTIGDRVLVTTQVAKSEITAWLHQQVDKSRQN